jgi:hypothetical protein
VRWSTAVLRALGDEVQAGFVTQRAAVQCVCQMASLQQHSAGVFTRERARGTVYGAEGHCHDRRLLVGPDQDSLQSWALRL